MQRASRKILMRKFVRFPEVRSQADIPGRRLTIQDHHTVPHQFTDAELFIGKFQLAAFQIIDIQHIVDQRQQMLRRCLDLLSAVLLPVGILRILLGNIQHTHDPVDRRAHIMRHMRHKLRLCPVGFLRIADGNLQFRIFRFQQTIGFLPYAG